MTKQFARPILNTLFLPLVLTGCMGLLPAPAPTSNTPVAPSNPAQPSQPQQPPPATRKVPTFSFTPTDRVLSIGGTGQKTDAQLVGIATTPSQWPTLCKLHPQIQIAEEDLPDSDTQKTIFSALKASGCATFGVETNPVTQATVSAAGGIDGAIGQAAYTAAIGPLDKAIANGAALAQIATNDPLAIGLSLGMTRQAAIQQIAIFETLMQQHYPSAVVGFNAVYPKMLSAQQIQDLQALNAAMKALGSRGLDYVREDFDATTMQAKGGSYSDLKIIYDYAASINLPFSLILGPGGWIACVKASGQPPSPADDHCWFDGLNSTASQIVAAGMHPYFDIQPDAEGVPSSWGPDSSTNTTTGAALGIVQTYGGSQ